MKNCDLFLDLEEIYMLAADADSTNWEHYCDLIRKKIYVILSIDWKDNKHGSK